MSHKASTASTTSAAIEVDLRDASDRLFFVFPELKASLQNQQQLYSNSSLDDRIRQSMQRQSGVLWKRRDVFKNSWRPRWFILNPGQGVLNYYLLSTSTTAAFAATVTTPTTTNPTSESAALSPPTQALRNRTTSWDSQVSAVSELSVDYDVVPRGTIYLLGCTVFCNDSLSKPNESLYAFTIVSNSSDASLNNSHIHLAARTAETRNTWVEQIDRVCRIGASYNNSNNDVSTESTIPSGLLTSRSRRGRPVREHSIPEGDSESVTHDDDIIPGQTTLGDEEVQMIQPTIHENEQELDLANSKDIYTWRSVGPSESLYENVPETLAARIQEILQRYLPIFNNDITNDPNWKLLFHNQQNGHSAFSKIDNQGRKTVKSVAVLNFPPKQVFRLLVDISKRHEFETNIRTDERMQILNSYTFLDYYAYNAVWPTAAREFTVATHWHVVTRGSDETAIVMVSFSCPEAEVMKAPVPQHVRGNLLCSIYLLQGLAGLDGEEQCHLTRFLSFDLCGGINQKLSNVVVAQQAGLPVVLQDYLQRTQPVTENRLHGLRLSNDSIRVSVVDPLQANDTKLSNGVLPYRLELDGGTQQSEMYNTITIDPGLGKNDRDNLPSVESQAVLLLTPTIVYVCLAAFGMPGAQLIFLGTAFATIRQLVVWFLGPALPNRQETSLVGPITCRLHVDLKGVLRFIANKREEREEAQQSATADISVVHIVASALARAMRIEPELHYRRVTLPWLLIDQIVDTSKEPVDISISENLGGIVTLKAVDRKKIQSIADELAEAQDRTIATKTMGRCLIVAFSGNDDSDVETVAAPIHPNMSVVAIVGGVHLEHKSGMSSRSSKVQPSPRPVLSVSLTMNGYKQIDIVTCRKYAEEVRKLLLYPEMCEV